MRAQRIYYVRKARNKFEILNRFGDVVETTATKKEALEDIRERGGEYVKQIPLSFNK